MHEHLHPGEIGARLLDLIDAEALVHRAEPVPEDHPGLVEGVGVVAAERPVGVPHRHAFERHPHRLGGVASEVLVGEEQHALPALESPFEHGCGIRRGADDAAVLAAEPLQRCRGVHVGDGDDGHPAIGIRLGAVERLELLPGLHHRIDVGHVGHRAARGQIGQDDRLLRACEDVGGLGHEVHAAEDDRLRVRLRPGRVRELEGVADEVRIRHDLVALVEVAEDDDPVTEGLLRGTDAGIQLVVGGGAVLLGDLALARGAGRNDVAHRRAGAVARGRLEVEDPWTFGEIGAAGGAVAGPGADELDGGIDGRHGDSS